MRPLIDIEHVTFSYPQENGQGIEVLHDITLQIPAGEFVAVLGHNGSGKSTIAKHMNAILLPMGGKVYFSGLDTAEEENLLPIRRQIGMVFQNPDNQIVSTIVEEDVAFALENLGIAPEKIRERVDEALRAVDMYHYRLHAPHQLSGGQKQRIAIAGVLAMHPRCIVLDEPTAMLDPKGRQEVMRVLHELHRQYHTTVVLITHFMEEAVQAERVVVMDDGKILLDDTPRAVFVQIDRLKAVGLDVPQVTELAAVLRAAGVNIPAALLTEDECVAALTAALEETDGNHTHA